jgi:hypothetical protein
MVVYLDADGMPFRDVVTDCARRFSVTVVAVTDRAHEIAPEEHLVHVTVDSGRDAVDFAIVNRVRKGDVVVTQDLGLASLVLHKGAVVISPRGHLYREKSMDRQLYVRWLHRKIRAAGGKVRGPRRLSHVERDRFRRLLEKTMAATHRRNDEPV